MASRPDAPRIAIVHPVMALGGGTEAITAWSIDALKLDFQVSLITFSSVNAQEINKYYGTDLRDDEFTLIRPSLPGLIKNTRRFSLLKDHLMMRHCKSNKGDFDLFFGVGGMMEFGSWGLQYFGLAPGSAMVKVLAKDSGMSTLSYLLKKWSMEFYALISSYSYQEAQKNLTLVTSQWAGGIARNAFAVAGHEVVYPPVVMPPSDTPWEEREDRFLCVARIVPEKRLEQAIQIIKMVREQGFDVSLTIVGRQDDASYLKVVQGLAAENSPWVKIVDLLAKEELGRLMANSKYGINAADDEPFGIAVAEMVKAGSIVFVANGGGQTEIVDSPNLIFDSAADAAEKIARVVRTANDQETLREHLRNRGEEFSAQAFCQRLRELVEASFPRAGASQAKVLKA